MNFINRNFGNLLILLVIGGLALGAGLAHTDAQIPYLTLLKPTPTPTQVLRAPVAAGGGSPAPRSGPQMATPLVAPQVTPGATGTPLAGGPPSRSGVGRGTTGTVQSVEDRTISITAQDGTTIKVAVTDSTTYQKTETISVADLKVGDAVVVMGREGSDGTVTAQSIQVGSAPAAGAGQIFGAGGRQTTGIRLVTGTIQAIAGNVLTIAQQDGQTVKVTPASDARLTRVVAASLSDVQPGEQVTVIGQPGAEGVITATMVQISSVR